MEFKGKREVYIMGEVSPFFAKAAKLILTDLKIDFDKAVIEYADDEYIEMYIDDKDMTLYYQATEEGFEYRLVDSDEYDDLVTAYEEYGDGWDDADPEDDGFGTRGMYDDDDMEDYFSNPYFQIAFSTILNVLEIDPTEHELELLYYDDEDIGVCIDGRDAEIHLDLQSDNPFVLEWITGNDSPEEDGEDKPPDNIIPFSNYSLF